MAIHIERSGVGMVGRLVSDDPGIRSRKLMTMPYAEYLQSPEWDVTRRAALKASGYRCQVCNGDGELHVHHRTYERRGVELPNDVVALCAKCHSTFHETSMLTGQAG